MKNKTSRMRKSTKYSIIAISVFLIIFFFTNFISNLQEENMGTSTKEIYKYTDKFNYDYKINLIENKYMTNEEVENKNLAYVTDLIKNIGLQLNYEYTADKSSNLKYSYSIIGKMQAVYTKNGKEQKIWEREETLLDLKEAQRQGKKINISENLILDLKDKNTLINNFKQQLGMTVEAKYTINLNVKVSTEIEGEVVVDQYTPVLSIDLAEKTTEISGENNTEKTEYISKEYKVSGGTNVIRLVVDGIILLIAVLTLVYALKSKTMNTVRNEYKYELNRILKLCQDKIVMVSTRPNDDEQDVIYVKDFGEIVKVSEELFKPILYYIEKDDEEAWFSVMSGKTSYRYILKK